MKTDTVTNITIQKMTERNEHYTTVEITDHKIITRLLINFKVILIVVETVFPVQNMSYSINFVFWEDNVTLPKIVSQISGI